MTEPTLIFETLHGSRAYGLASEGSDTDTKRADAPKKQIGEAKRRSTLPAKPDAEALDALCRAIVEEVIRC